MSYRSFTNRDCPYFPCHDGADEATFNCLFCYCPLYALGDKCGGGFSYNERGIKDCSKCTLPHSEAGYAHVTGKFFELSELAQKNRTVKEADPALSAKEETE